MAKNDKNNKFILWFDEIGIEDVPLVGGKNASLGEMYQQLSSKGVRVPNGFAVTAAAYRHFIKEAGLMSGIKQILQDVDPSDTRKLVEKGAAVRRMILNAEFPKDIADAIRKNYAIMEEKYNKYVDVAVRSSATAEDLPDASFAGQQETYLNVVGAESLLECCRKCVASLFTNRAISYRVHKGFDHFSIALSICVQKMVRSDRASSGVTFTIDTESGFDNVVLITGSWGLGENIVGGKVNPDEFLVFKKTLKDSKPIIHKKLGSKKWTMIYQPDALKPTLNVATEKVKRETFCVSDEDILTIARWSVIIEEHYTEKRGTYTPMDIEWAKDGRSQELFIVQARPETVQSQKDKNSLITYHLRAKESDKKVLARGTSVGSTISCGKSRVLKGISGMHDFIAGEVLITEMTDPDWEPIIKIAKAVVTNRGGRTCHAAIISRELGIPCIVGCGNATATVPTGMDVTINCAEGEDGVVYEGTLPFEIEKHDLVDIPKLKTKLCMNLANPEIAFQKSFIPNSGVGLARMEFIVSNHIKCHPLALLEYDASGTGSYRNRKSEKLTSKELKKIYKLIKPYKTGADYFVEKLAQGVGMIAAAFYPKRVILRFSDFKTNEYASLLGGSAYEPQEDNPMLGWRGASRYYDPKYEKGFELECRAVKKVREVFGLTNLQVMIPFCRTVDEAVKVVAKMASCGLDRKNGLEIMGMCEIPSNVILAEEFLQVLDGFSIGSNDLTQLVLGVDRNSEIIASLFDERNPAVKKVIKQVIDTCNRMNKYVGICGQGPSDYPDFALFLIECGIQSISLNPDTIIKTMSWLAEKEKTAKK